MEKNFLSNQQRTTSNQLTIIFAAVQLKDHYTVLEIAASASVEEIKKAYRKLAHQYHPDKNGDDPYAAAQFTAIKEAYETLTNPIKREYYLQQRWYAKSTGRINPQEIITPVLILKKLLELDKYVSKLDVHRMDYTSLSVYINDLLSTDNIQTIQSFNDSAVNKEIIVTTLKLFPHIPYPLNESLATQLKKIATDQSGVDKIDNLLQRSRSIAYWDKKRTLLVLILAILLCLFIFMLTK